MTAPNFGQGFLTQIVRTQAHVLNLAAAAIHEWPMTAEQGLAELREAQSHLDNAIATPLSDAAAPQLATYRTSLETLDQHLNSLVDNDTDSKLIDDPNTLVYAKAAATACFNLAAALDLELTGLRADQVDAGTHP